MAIFANSPGPLSKADRKDIEAFQRAAGLHVDGEIGRQTWQYMHGLIAKRQTRIEKLERENAELLAGCEARSEGSGRGGFLSGVATGIALTVVVAALAL